MAFERSLAAVGARSDFRVCHYSLQRDHVHYIVEAEDAAALGRGMQALGTRLARACNGVFGRRGRVIADRYHLQILRTPRQVRAALGYVLRNAQKHARQRGIASRYALDSASSARWFEGWRGRAPGGGEGPVARARTWLLSTGWKRHGLVPLRI